MEIKGGSDRARKRSHDFTAGVISSLPSVAAHRFEALTVGVNAMNVPACDCARLRDSNGWAERQLSNGWRRPAETSISTTSAGAAREFPREAKEAGVPPN